MVDDPGEVLVGVRGVDDEQIFVLLQAIDQQVIDKGSLGGRQGRVLNHAGIEARGIIGRQVLNEGQCVRTFDQNFPHVPDIEQSGPGPDGHVFVDDSLEFDGHFPAEKLNHPAPEFLVEYIQAGRFHDGVLSDMMTSMDTTSRTVVQVPDRRLGERILLPQTLILL